MFVVTDRNDSKKVRLAAQAWSPSVCEVGVRSKESSVKGSLGYTAISRPAWAV